jgi:hypothetical protein
MQHAIAWSGARTCIRCLRVLNNSTVSKEAHRYSHMLPREIRGPKGKLLLSVKRRKPDKILRFLELYFEFFLSFISLFRTVGTVLCFSLINYFGSAIFDFGLTFQVGKVHDS